MAGGTVAPACRVHDWPDFPIRGALMSEMTEMNNLDKVGVPCWDRTPPHTSGGFCAQRSLSAAKMIIFAEVAERRKLQSRLLTRGR